FHACPSRKTHSTCCGLDSRAAPTNSNETLTSALLVISLSLRDSPTAAIKSAQPLRVLLRVTLTVSTPSTVSTGTSRSRSLNIQCNFERIFAATFGTTVAQADGEAAKRRTIDAQNLHAR